MEDIPEDVRSQLTFHCVSTLDEVFDIALLPMPTAHGPAEKTLMEEEEEAAAAR
jgi:ATP-dependent Lon protease